jgi:hypothetical protein
VQPLAKVIPDRRVVDSADARELRLLLRAPRAATWRRRREAWLRIFAVRCSSMTTAEKLVDAIEAFVYEKITYERPHCG